MAGPHILFTPVGSAVELDLDLEGGVRATAGPFVELAGGRRSDSVTSVGHGGQAVTVVHDAWFQYRAQFAPLTDPWTTGTGPTQPAQHWHKLHAWISHTQLGGLFTLRVDNDLTWADALTNAETEGTTTPVEVADTTGVASGEWLFIEDADNPVRCEFNRVSAVPGGTSLTLARGLAYDYAAGSVVRHRELFVDCLRLAADRTPLVERRAGRGPNAWDLRFEFRTTRT